MKQKLLVIAFVLFVFLFFGCSQTEQPEYFGNKNMSFEDYDFSKIYETGEHYVIYQCEQDKPFNKFYWYKLLDDNKNVILNGGTEWKIPIIAEDENIISVELDYGTLADVHRYYDIESNSISKEFHNVLAQNNSMICYFENGRIIITDAFDNSIFYQTVCRDYADMAMPIDSVKFVDDCTLEILYYISEDTIASEQLQLYTNQKRQGARIRDGSVSYSQ